MSEAGKKALHVGKIEQVWRKEGLKSNDKSILAILGEFYIVILNCIQ